jgi:arylsulfatase A-like enzyme
MRHLVGRPIALGEQPGGRFDLERFTADYVVSQTEFGDRLAVRGGRWKHIVSEDDESLFDLARNPRETENRKDECRDLLQGMRTRRGRFERNRSERRRISTALSAIVDEPVVPR